MSLIKITLPNGAVPVDGLQVSFRAPAMSSGISGLSIDGENYAVVDSNGLALCGCAGAWGYGEIVTCTLDVTNKRAVLNASAIGKAFKTIYGTFDAATSTYVHELTSDDTDAILNILPPVGGTDAPHNINIGPGVSARPGATMEIINSSNYPIYINSQNEVLRFWFRRNNEADAVHTVVMPGRCSIVKIVWTSPMTLVITGDFETE